MRDEAGRREGEGRRRRRKRHARGRCRLQGWGPSSPPFVLDHDLDAQ